MKILAIMGSPHAGNTLDMVRNIGDKLRECGEVDYEIVNLKDIDLKYCTGCYTCFQKGAEFCPLKDDIKELASKLDEADGVIFATPVYSMHVTYLLKNMIDRLAFNYHRPRYMGKYALAVAVQGITGKEDTLKYLKQMSVMWGFDAVGELGYFRSPKGSSMTSIIKAKDMTGDVVRDFYTAIKEKRPKRLTVADYIHFSTMHAAYSMLEKISPVDYRHFKDRGWLDKKAEYFHTNVRGNVFGNMIGKLVGWLTLRQIEKGMKDL